MKRLTPGPTRTYTLFPYTTFFRSGEKLGWERPNWYADWGRGEAAEDRYSFGRPNWFEAVGREHRAAREAAVLFDQSSFAKFVLKGPDAEDALSWICANNVARPVGSLTYTQMLHDKGGIHCDLTGDTGRASGRERVWQYG